MLESVSSRSFIVSGLTFRSLIHFELIHSTSFLGATAHLTNNTIIKITWKYDKPIWTEQWPLMKDKLQAAKELIGTQLKLKHIEESCSPWNSPIFVIKKKKKI